MEELQKENDLLKARLDKASQVFKTQKEETKALQSKLDVAEAKIKELESSTVNVGGDAEELERLKSELADAQKKIENYEAEKVINGSVAEDMEKLRQECIENQARLSKAKSIFESYKKEIEVKDGELSKMKELNVALESKLAEITEHANASIDKANANIEEANKNIEDLNNALDNVTAENTKKDTIIAELTDKLNNANSEIEKYKQSLPKLKENVSRQITDMQHSVGSLKDKFDQEFNIFS